jgi:hypothetical protein
MLILSQRTQNPAVRVFILEEAPSVMHPAQPLEVAHPHQANAGNSPAIAAVMMRLQMQRIMVDKVRASAFGEGSEKTDTVAIKLKDPNKWDQAEPVIKKVLEDRLKDGGGIIVTPSLATDFSAADEKDIKRTLVRILPETVYIHNESEEDKDPAKALLIESWSPESGELSLVMGEACGEPDKSSNCGDLAQEMTKRTITKHLGAALPGVHVRIR